MSQSLITAASLRGTRVPKSIAATTAVTESIRWHNCFLDELTLFDQNGGFKHWKRTKGKIRYELAVGYAEARVGLIHLRIYEVSSSDPVLRAQCNIPRPKSQCEIFLFEPLYRLSISFFDGGSTKPTQRWILQLPKPDGTSSWNRMKVAWVNLSAGQLRYVNLHRKLNPKGLIDPAAHPRTVRLDLPGFSTNLVFVHTIASKAFQEAKARLLGPNMSSSDDSSDPPPKSRAPSSQARALACPICKTGKVKASKHQQKQKRAQGFIGCQAGTYCEAETYWHHFKCVGLDAKMFVRTSKKWWCEECRVDKTVGDDGYEPKT